MPPNGVQSITQKSQIPKWEKSSRNDHQIPYRERKWINMHTIYDHNDSNNSNNNNNNDDDDSCIIVIIIISSNNKNNNSQQ